MNALGLLSRADVITLLSIVLWQPVAAANQVVAFAGGVARTNGFPGDAVAIAAGEGHLLTLYGDGTLSAWQTPHCGTDLSPAELPDALTNVFAISAGGRNSLALLADGTVTAWGNLTNVPPTWTNIVAIDCGRGHNLAVTSHGTVLAWGYNSAAFVNMPPELSNVVAVAGGDGHSVALKGDGTVMIWGTQSYVPEHWTNVVAIAAGRERTVALFADGTVEKWGDDDTYNVPAGLSNVVAVAADQDGTLALKADGTVAGWGYNFCGESMVPPGLSNVVGVAQAWGFGAVLMGDGPPFITVQPLPRAVVMSGQTHFRVEATGQFPLRYQWKHEGTNIPGATGPVLSLTNLQPVHAGDYSVDILNDFGGATSRTARLELIPLQIFSQPVTQTQYVGGSVEFQTGVHGIPPLFYQWKLGGTNIPGATNAVLRFPSLNGTESGSYTVVVTNIYGAVTSQTAQLTVVPVLITAQPQNQVGYPGGPVSFAVAAEGVGALSYQWLRNGEVLLGETNESLSISNARTEQSGSYSVVVRNQFGAVESKTALLQLPPIVAWGRMPQAAVPGHLTNVIAIASGAQHGLAILPDRRVIAWGDGSYGQMDIPPETTNIAAVTSGSGALQSIALRLDGSFVAWGTGMWPPPIPAATNVVAATSSSWFASALQNNGTVIGAGSGWETKPPADLSDVVAIAGGQAHTLALRADGTVAAWGYGSPTAPPDPYWNKGQATVPATLTDVVAIAAGGLHSMALRSNGTVFVWGDGSAGETNVPPGLTNVVRIASGEHHCMALKSDGTVVVWGSSWMGLTNVPAGLTNVIAIAAGGQQCLALVGEQPLEAYLRIPSVSYLDGQFTLTVPTESGRVYRLNFADSLLQGTWSALPLELGNGESRLLSDPNAQAPQRFYDVAHW